MKLARAFVFGIPLAALAVTSAHDAGACGGCFVPPQENTQVTGHRMVLSVSPTTTTLWDQITYSGDPSSFAWVLPIKGIVDIKLSSDALFAFLGQSTEVSVSPPPLNCPPPPPNCFQNGAPGGDAATAGSSGAGGGGGAGGVTVVAQKVVGPYETVQLKASDPKALDTWLAGHGYSIPADVTPIVDAYVSEGFGFLAMKLVPGAGLTAMRPVSISMGGAMPSLPLRMVGAGTGAVTPITLWVLGEGRYEATNFETLTIDTKQIVWNWDTYSSNYALLRHGVIDASNGQGWLAESANPTSANVLTGNLLNVATNNPTVSGYGDAMGQGAVQECQDDIARLVGTINPAAFWVTRLHAELPHAALSKDLQIGASATQTPLPTSIQAVQSEGTVPQCPDYSWCAMTTSGSNGVGGGFGFSSSGGPGVGSGMLGATLSGSGGAAAHNALPIGGCAVESGTSSSTEGRGLGFVALLALIGGLRRRPRASR